MPDKQEPQHIATWKFKEGARVYVVSCPDCLFAKSTLDVTSAKDEARDHHLANKPK